MPAGAFKFAGLLDEGSFDANRLAILPACCIYIHENYFSIQRQAAQTGPLPQAPAGVCSRGLTSGLPVCATIQNPQKAVNIGIKSGSCALSISVYSYENNSESR
ncbi:hypothetical protein [Polaromonas naphthalenivorans]|uniref:Uncharacterized protein n=1 Tax=Polaromonas naphthalenivorans (strain CJ2) TaxID=365044 RepID=A1VRS5_POLNA|nr:hypothetical protein [Polaromonas naphthalenivorans]ABM38353.1 hypothetical protein Pnap_3054 [Polaromonas naphthalenivorans CJ2]